MPCSILWFCENTHISEYMGIYGIYLGPSNRINAMATSEKNENSAGVTLHFETYAKAQKVTSLSIKRLSNHFKTIWNDYIIFEPAVQCSSIENNMIKDDSATSDFKGKNLFKPSKPLLSLP